MWSEVAEKKEDGRDTAPTMWTWHPYMHDVDLDVFYQFLFQVSINGHK